MWGVEEDCCQRSVRANESDAGFKGGCVRRSLMLNRSPFPVVSFVLQSLARLGGQVHGIDAAAASVSIAELHAATDPALASNLRYSCCTAESLLASPDQY